MKKQMNQEVKKIWVDALRSGEYEQCKKKLYNGSAYCCLGVLCDLYAKSKGKKKAFEIYYNMYGFSFGEEEEGKNVSNLLPRIVMEWAGLEPFAITPDYNETDIRSGQAHNATWISGLNDKGKSFKQIADIIDKRM